MSNEALLLLVGVGVVGLTHAGDPNSFYEVTSKAVQASGMDYRAEAVRLFPKLAIAGSDLNKAFLAIVAQQRRDNPAFEKDPRWSITVAHAAVAAVYWEEQRRLNN